MDKIDYRKVFRESYAATAEPSLVVVPPMQFLVLDLPALPAGAPRRDEAVEALSTLASALRLLLKRGPMALDFRPMPLEVVCGADSPERLMIMQPPVVSAALVGEAVEFSRNKKARPIIDQIRLARIDEGKAVQLLHVGLPKEAGHSWAMLRQWAATHAVNLASDSHEIRLSDMRRTLPERRKTILRVPVRS